MRGLHRGVVEGFAAAPLEGFACVGCSVGAANTTANTLSSFFVGGSVLLVEG